MAGTKAGTWHRGPGRWWRKERLRWRWRRQLSPPSPPPLPHPVSWEGGSEPGWILNSPRFSPAGARAEAAHLGLRWHSRNCLSRAAQHPSWSSEKCPQTGSGCLCWPFFFVVGKQRSNSLRFAKELRVLSLLIISLHLCSAFTRFKHSRYLL